MKKHKKWVILEGVKYGNLCFTLYNGTVDCTISPKGEVWYDIIGFADTVKEAMDFIDKKKPCQ
jgi:hypothetical protein